MIFNNEEWACRTILDCSFLISQYTNEIIDVSPLIAELLVDYKGMVEAWAKDHEIEEEAQNKLLNFLKDKRVLINATGKI